jgi:hypothetical protein
MKKLVTITLVVAAAVATLATSALVRGPAAQQRTKRDVIMMRCEAGSSGFKVTSYSASASAPSKKADNCAESVSTLHRDGFMIEDAGYVDAEDGYMVLVLVR